MATGTGANAVLGGVGRKAYWVYRLLGKEYPQVMDEFGNSRPANLQASHIGTCILKTYSSIDPEG